MGQKFFWAGPPAKEGGESSLARGALHIRDRSCRLRCSLLLKALLQNWHLYFRSGASEGFREAGVDAAEGGRTATLAPGILTVMSRRGNRSRCLATALTAVANNDGYQRLGSSNRRRTTDVEDGLVPLSRSARAPVAFKVRLW